MKCSIIDRSTISFDHLATPLQHIILDRFAVGGSCKIARTDPAHFAEGLGQPGSTSHTNVDQQYADWWSKQIVGPINYWTLRSFWCLLKENMEWHAINDAINGNMCDSLVIRVEADTNHKSAKFFFTPFVIKCIISQKQGHQLANIYHSFFADKH